MTSSLPPQSSQPPSSWPPVSPSPSTSRPELDVSFEAPTKISGLAIASLVLGIVGAATCGLGSVIGLILGIVSIGSTIGNPPQRRGKGIAIAGIVVSAISFFVGIGAVLTGLMLPALAKARQSAQRAASTFHLQNVAQAQQLYLAANNDYFPPSDNWAAAVAAYAAGPNDPGNILIGPMRDERTIAMNSGLADKRLGDLTAPFKTVLLFEAAAGSPPAGGLDLVPSSPYNREGYMVVFVDGSVRLVPEFEIETLVWDP